MEVKKTFRYAMKTNFLAHLHALRGIAIVTILGAHAWSFIIFWTGSLNDDIKPLFQFTESLFHGSTLYFALISGVLFSKVLSTKRWRTFYQSKFTNVVLPYLVMTVFYTLLYWQGTARYLEENGQEPDLLLTLLSNFGTAGSAIHFWYIPVLLFLFAMTPLLWGLLQQRRWTLVILAAAPLVISRSTFPNFLEPQSFIYFLGAYSLGMLIGKHLEELTVWTRNHRILLFIVSVLTTATIFGLFKSGYEVSAWYSVIQTLIYIQKVAIFMLLMQWLESMQESIPKVLIKLGDYAFAIFFLHLFVMGTVISLVGDIAANNRDPITIFALGTLNIVVAVSGSMLIAWILKKIFKKHSRKLVGA